MSTSWRQALDAQMAQWRWARSDMGQHLLRWQCETEAAPLPEQTRDLLRSVYAGEEAKLLGADPIFVSAEMCEVVAAASSPDQEKPFQPEPFYVTDLVTPNGFLLYETPFDVPDRFERPVQISAVAWQPMFSVAKGEDPGSLDAEALMRHWNESGAQPLNEESGSVEGIGLSIYGPMSDDSADLLRERGRTPPPLELVHITPWWFGMSFEGNEVDPNGVETGAAWWWRIVQTTYRLMQQRIAASHQERSERHQRRAAARIHFPERETLVIRLRREKRDGEHGDSEPANYSHRFVVGGHWRNQWYPASETHRQLWISPYIKGDEDLPLVIKPKRAMVWTR